MVSTHFLVEARAGHFVKALLERGLIVLGSRELEKYPRGRLCEGEGGVEVHLLADRRRLLEAQLVAGRQQERPLREEVLGVRDLRVGVNVGGAGARLDPLPEGLLPAEG